MPSTKTLALFADTVTLTTTDDGVGPRTYLLVHGGAGPGSMMGLAQALVAEGARVVVPTLPGFDGTPRPAWVRRVEDLATVLLAAIEEMDLREVVLVGSSLGGWTAAEIALRGSPRVAKLAMLNAVGIAPAPGAPILDPAKLPPQERAAAAFHDPAKFGFVPAPEALAMLQENQRALRVYAGEPFMHDPSLADRLGGVRVPATVMWGASDRIAGVAYGRRFAAAMSGASFHVIEAAGHFPHIEQRDQVMALLRAPA